MNRHWLVALLILLMGSAAFLYAQPFTEYELRSLFYADLGRDSINVSSYPQQQKKEYAVFRQACSKCHTLARAINSPTVSRQAWEYYVIKMRMWMDPHHPRYTHEEADQIVDFLTYDSKVRKVDRRSDFDAMTRKLQIRFSDTINARTRRLQMTPHQPGVQRLEGRP